MPEPEGTAADRALIDRILAGERAAFDELVHGLHGRLLRVANSYVRNDATAAEVVQETWQAVFKQLPGFEGRASLKSWIFTILTNQAKTRAMREKRWVPFSALADADDDRAVIEPESFGRHGSWASALPRWSAETPEALLMRREALEDLERAIDALPAAQKAVVTMRDVVGLGSEEVCNALEISEINQRVLLHRARARLRLALAEHLEDG